jgi:hypothetical protein
MIGLETLDEYSNSGALIGLDGLDDNELLGALKRMNPIKRQRTINKLANTGAPSKGSRAEMEKHFNELPQHIKDGLASGQLRLMDTLIYTIKPVISKTIKLFETQDVQEVSISNITNAKLPKNSALLVSGIYLLAGVSVDASKDSIKSTLWSGLENFNALANGELDLKANKKQIFPELNTGIFKTSTFHQVPTGYYKLANPRLIEDDILIELTLNLGSMTGLAPTTYIYAALHGTITAP